MRLAEAMVSEFEIAQPRLDALDAQGGDADHGTTMVLAARAALRAVGQRSVAATQGDCFALIGDGFASVGGTVGPLWGAAWYAVADAVDGPERPDLVATCLASMVEAIRSLGAASEGDGTMLDALIPAARAANDASSSAAAVVQAAEAGAASTTGRRARIGRAARAAVTRVGPDPGAASAVLVVRLLVPVLANW